MEAFRLFSETSTGRCICCQMDGTYRYFTEERSTVEADNINLKKIIMFYQYIYLGILLNFIVLLLICVKINERLTSLICPVSSIY